MSKKDKVIKKAKVENSAESLEAKLKSLSEEKAAYYKENGLKVGKDYANDKKHGAYITKITKAIKEVEEAIKEIKGSVKEAAGEIKKSAKKIKEAVKSVASKYEYPADVVTAEQKKKYRRDMRAAAAKAAKGETKPKKEAKQPKKGKEEKPSKPAKVAKEEKVVEDED